MTEPRIFSACDDFEGRTGCDCRKLQTHWTSFGSIRPLFLATALAAASGLIHAQTAPAAPKFEVASVKPCKDNAAGRGGSDDASPARLDLNCITVRGLIQDAYILYANGQMHPVMSVRLTPIEGGPGWIGSERYDITAKAEGQPGPAIMKGPMLAALLEERFQLKIHRETRELPVYALTVGKNGYKLKPAAEGACTPNNFFNPTVPPGTRQPAAPGQKPICIGPRMGRNGPNRTMEIQSITLAELCQLLSDGPMAFAAGRPVIDKTGIAGRFDFKLEVGGGSAGRGAGGDAGDAAGATGPEPEGPTIYAALQQIGLKLEPAKGPAEFLVIDHVERPSGN